MAEGCSSVFAHTHCLPKPCPCTLPNPGYNRMEIGLLSNRASPVTCSCTLIHLISPQFHHVSLKALYSAMSLQVIAHLPTSSQKAPGSRAVPCVPARSQQEGQAGALLRLSGACLMHAQGAGGQLASGPSCMPAEVHKIRGGECA